MNSTQKRVGLLLIGDELLNGCRKDLHLPAMIDCLAPKGMDIAWVRMLGDEENLLVEALQNSFQSSEIVFSFGGIGATPDDVTRQCVAKALSQPLVFHHDLLAILQERMGDRLTQYQKEMARIPDGASLIPNPVNQIAGFKMFDHHFLPGFPEMAWPMAEWVLQEYYSECFAMNARLECRWLLHDCSKGQLIPMMQELLQKFPKVQLSSLPSIQKKIDFGLKGEKKHVQAASQWLLESLATQDIRVDCIDGYGLPDQ